LRIILWRTDPLLSGDCKQRPLLGNARKDRTVFSVSRAAAVSGKWLGEHVTAAKDTNATMYGGFYVVRPEIL
jgi:hypothetical protein